MELRISGVYVLSVEEQGDYLFTPAGIVIKLTTNRFQIYCAGSQHNLFRAVLHRLDWGELERGLPFREMEFRLTNVTERMIQRGWTHSDAIPAILEHLWKENERHLFFLAKHIEQHKI